MSKRSLQVEAETYFGLGLGIEDIFEMLDCKAIATPMALNLKLLCDASLEIVDATMYRQIICSLMYLTNTRPDICFVVNTLS